MTGTLAAITGASCAAGDMHGYTHGHSAEQGGQPGKPGDLVPALRARRQVQMDHRAVSWGDRAEHVDAQLRTDLRTLAGTGHRRAFWFRGGGIGFAPQVSLLPQAGSFTRTGLAFTAMLLNQTAGLHQRGWRAAVRAPVWPAGTIPAT